MKKLNILLILGLALLLVSCATVKTSEVEGSSVVVEVPGVSQDELFVRASSWMTEVFNSAKTVTQYSDKEAGIIKGGYIITFPQGLGEVECNANFTIECKDGKSRLVISAPYGYETRDGRYSMKVSSLTEGAYEKLTGRMERLCESFEKYMSESHDEAW